MVGFIGKKAMSMTMAAAVLSTSLVTPALVAPAHASELGAEDAWSSEKTSVEVSSKWFGAKGESVEVSLLADGVPVEDAILNEDNEWKHTFSDLDKISVNGPIVYTVTEKTVDGYISQVNGDTTDGFIVVNLETPDHAGFAGTTSDIDVSKSWIGEEGANAQINLLIDGYEIDSIVLDVSNNWNYAFTDMPVVENDEGKPVTYTVAEPNYNGYDTRINGNSAQGFIVSNIEANHAQVEGQIVSKFVDANGVEIAYRVTTSGVVGSQFQTNAKDIPGYTFKAVTGVVAGNLGVGVNEVVYQYEKTSDVAYVEGQVVSRFVDDKGTEIALPVSNSGEIGSDFEITPKVIPGYAYVKAEGTVKGKYVGGIAEVKFTYKEDVKADTPVIGAVITKYVDRNGKEIAERKRTSGKVGEKYETTWDAIPGYGLVRIDGGTMGKFTEGIHIVTYEYAEIKDEVNFENGGNIVVKYTDRDGNEIAARERVAGNIGDRYQTTKKAIAGYEYVEVVGEVSGKFGDKTRVVEYVYKKIGNEIMTEGRVVVQYVDTFGHEIASYTELTGKVGDAYKVVKKDIAGYKFKAVLGNESGKYSTNATVITYAYEKISDVVNVEGQVIVSYVDTNGVILAEPTKLAGKVDSTYATQGKNIEGYTLSKVTGNQTGKYVNGVYSVVYVYALNSVDTNKPVVTPDKNGNTPVVTPDANKPGTVVIERDSNMTGNMTIVPDKNAPGEIDPNPSADPNALERVYDKSKVEAPGVQQDGKPEMQEGKKLAETATNTYNMLGLGSLMLVLASISLFFVNRRRKATDAE